MNFTLVGTRNGRTYTFFIEALAKTYQQAYGGVIVDLRNAVSEPQPVTT